MASKKLELQKLRAELDNYKELYEFFNAKYQELLGNGEHSFLNSPTYLQMKEKISYLENCVKLNEWHLQNVGAERIKRDDAVHQVYEDNKRLVKNQECPEYFIGITETFHSAEEFASMKDQTATLRGKVDGLTIILDERNKEIERLQSEIAELQYNQLCSLPEESQQNDFQKTEHKKTENGKQGKYEFEDAVRYEEALQRIKAMEADLQKYQTWLSNSNKRIEELQKQNTDLAITAGDAVKVAEENIDKSRQLSKDNQKRKGRPPKVDEYHIALIKELHRNGHSLRNIAKQLGLAVGTVNKYIKME